MRGLYGGSVRGIGWLTRERTVGHRAAPSVADWALALALFAIGLLEIYGGTFPGPVGLVVVVLRGWSSPAPPVRLGKQRRGRDCDRRRRVSLRTPM